jgi:NADP-dependent 3-hydroxy acid dehydrogenase YdfG
VLHKDDMTSISPITPGIALITGASSGIGKASAFALHKAGWTVILVARRKEALDEAVDQMNGGGVGRARAIPADLAVEDEILAVFETVKKEYGRLDLLFNVRSLSTTQKKNRLLLERRDGLAQDTN